MSAESATNCLKHGKKKRKEDEHGAMVGNLDVVLHRHDDGLVYHWAVWNE